jgi:hypothetical protein
MEQHQFLTQAFRHSRDVSNTAIRALALLPLIVATVLLALPLLILPFTTVFGRVESILNHLQTWTDTIVNGSRPPS